MSDPFIYLLPDKTSRVNAILVAVFPFVHKDVKDMNWEDMKKVMEVEPEPIFLEDIVIQMTCTTGKANHRSSFQAALKDPSNVINRIAPNDWMMVWMFDSIEKRNEVRELVRRGKAANKFSDGLKFVGRVVAVSKDLSINQSNGQVAKTIQIAGNGFVEFDTAVYFDPALDFGDKAKNLFWLRLTSGLAKINTLKNFTVDYAINSLVGLFFGQGPHPSASRVKLNKLTGKEGPEGDKTLTVSPNTCFYVPIVIAKILGANVKDPDATHVTYSSILRSYYGVQRFSTTSPKEFWEGFVPDIGGVIGTRYVTDIPLSGTFGPIVNPWPGVPIWSILQNFLNPSLNEMYTSLRVDPSGNVHPTLTVRQIPFNSKETVAGLPCTAFLGLPRWYLPIGQITKLQVAKSNSQHINFAQVSNVSPINGLMEKALGRANNPPVIDNMDIIRSGVYPSIHNTNNFPPEVAGMTPGKSPVAGWTSVVADRVFGMHLKWSGQVVCKGIAEPICEGDNIQIGDLVYHIEQVTHTIGINQSNGAIMWDTTLGLSAGTVTDRRLPDKGADDLDTYIPSNTTKEIK